MPDKELLKDIVEDEEAFVPTIEQNPMNITDEVKKEESELEKIAPVDDSKALKTKSASKKVLLAILFIAVNCLAILLTVVMEFSGNKQPVPLSSVWSIFIKNWQWGLLAIIMFITTILAESTLRFLLLRTTLRKNLPLVSISSTIVCKYYDNITPLGSGGQPFEVYYMRKKGIPIGIASGVPIVSYALGRFAYVFVSILAIAIHGFGQTSTFIKVMCIIGLSINLLIPCTIFFFTVLPKFANGAARFVAKVAAKLHITKDEEAFFDKLVSNITEYADCLRYFLKKSKINMFLGFLCSCSYFIALYSIPYFTIRLCGNHNVQWFELFALCIICYASIALLPTPGNAGGAELSFRSIFANFLTGGVLVWGMISWRIFSYYLFIIVGIIAIIIQQIYKFTKRGKAEIQSVNEYKEREKEREQERIALLKAEKLKNNTTEEIKESCGNSYPSVSDENIVESDEEIIEEAETVIETTIETQTDSPENTMDENSENAETLVEFSTVINPEKEFSEIDDKDENIVNNNLENIENSENKIAKTDSFKTESKNEEVKIDELSQADKNNIEDKSEKKHTKSVTKEGNSKEMGEDEEIDSNVIIPANAQSATITRAEKQIPHDSEDEDSSNIIKPLNSVKEREIKLVSDGDNGENVIKPLNSQENSVTHANKQIPHDNEDEDNANIIKPLNSDLSLTNEKIKAKSEPCEIGDDQERAKQESTK